MPPDPNMIRQLAMKRMQMQQAGQMAAAGAGPTPPTPTAGLAGLAPQPAVGAPPPASMAGAAGPPGLAGAGMAMDALRSSMMKRRMQMAQGARRAAQPPVATPQPAPGY